MSLALNATAKEVKAAAVDDLRRDLTNPSRWTLNSIGVKASTKANLNARVFYKEFAGKGVAAGKYLLAMETGGPRAAKRFERALQQAGVIYPHQRVIPADGGSIDLAGLSGRGVGGIYQKILSGLRASVDALQNETAASRKRKRRRGRRPTSYFATKDEAGFNRVIWERVSASVRRPVLIIVDGATYQPQLQFRARASRRFRSMAVAHLEASLARAMATAR
ncbi:MAG: hypothetical protein AAFU61_01285 [Pseudomonadota bacterium]